MTSTKTTTSLTPSLLTGIDTALIGVAPYTYIDSTPAEFVAWGRETGNLSDRLAAFIESRGDLAGGAPAAYVRLSHVGESAWFKGLPGDHRRVISNALLGDQAFGSYVDWVMANIAPDHD